MPTRRCGGRDFIRYGRRRPCDRPMSSGSTRRSRCARRGRRARGSSIDDYTAPDGDGSMQERLDVYQRAGQPCLRCGHRIKRIVIRARSTHFCSFCQRLPAADRNGAATILRSMTGGERRGGPRWSKSSSTAVRSPPTRRREPNGRVELPRPAGRPLAPPWEPDVDPAIRRRQPWVGAFTILDTIDSAIALGGRIGLVGPNGAGKTTLLRLAAGTDEPDRGTVSRKRDLSLGLLAQEAHLDPTFMASADLRAAVRAGAAHLESMALELATLEREGRVTEAAYADLQHRYEVLGGYTLDQRVDATLSGLGFDRRMDETAYRALGWEQTRAALARLVIADPDLLLLDEPTNHLDLGALEWLEDHLRRRTGSLLVASHDRAFLDATVTRIWELRDRRLTTFRGDYSAYRRQREERDARAVRSDTQADQIGRGGSSSSAIEATASSTRCTNTRARLERLLAQRREAPRASRKLALPRGITGRHRPDSVRRDRRAGGGSGRRLPAGARCARRRWASSHSASSGRPGPVPGRPTR